MKKLLILIPLTLILLLAACTPDIVQQGGLVVRGSSEQTDEATADEPASRVAPSAEETEQPYNNEDIVYATKTGKKYHLDGCSHLSKSKVPMSLQQAEQQELTPCSICYPAT